MRRSRRRRRRGVLDEDVVRQASAHLRVDEEGVEPEVELLAGLAPDLGVDADKVQLRLRQELDLGERVSVSI